jgi:hypothetical protein
MALASWFAKTRKFGISPSNNAYTEKIETRKLESTKTASARIFGHFLNPNPNKRTGRSVIRKNLRGPALERWWTPHLRTVPGLGLYKSEEERYKLAKNSFLRAKGRFAPKKGAGKKALKRMADAKKAAAKAKK